MRQTSKIAGVVAFTGHMMDKVGRVPPRFVPRFPKEMEDPVTHAIGDALDSLNARIGFCSAACGGDIIFIEQILKRGGEVHVVLPFGDDLVIRDCIKVSDDAGPAAQFQENRGREWLPRFKKIRRRAQTEARIGILKRNFLGNRNGTEQWDRIVQ